MVTHASGADLDTIVPAGDEGNKVCEEGVLLMADLLLPTIPGPHVHGESPKRRDQESRLRDGREPLEPSPRRALFHTSLPSGWREEKRRIQGTVRSRERTQK